MALAGCVLVHSSSFAEEAGTNPAYDAQPGDVSALKACVREKGLDARACIEIISDACAKQPSDDPVQFTLMNCWARENSGWDKLLNERYAELVARAKEQDAAPGGYQERESYSTLRDAQRAWVAFRDADLGRFWMMRAPAASWWRSADLERLRLELTATRYIDLLTVE